ncbi:MAG: hypothetical protein ABJN11_10475 [Lentilitoribacter sp.]
MNDSLGLFQVVYDEKTRKNIPNLFRPLDISKQNKPDLRELVAFKQFTQNRTWDKFRYSGIFSPKFLQKTRINPQEMVDFINKNPGHDIYLFHPYPLEFSIANHFLELAELEHPGITDALSHVWSLIFDTQLPHIELPKEMHLVCHCNFFVASPRFWKKYSVFVSKFYELAAENNNRKLLKFTPYTLSEIPNDSLQMSTFCFERALSLFIKDQAGELSSVNYCSHHPDHVYPELFDGEITFVQTKLHSILKSENKEMERSAAVLEYYNHRRYMTAGKRFMEYA